MNEPSLTLLAIADLHFTGLARQTAQPPQLRGELAQVLLRKVFARLTHMGVKPDLTVLLGDLTEDGTDPQAKLDLISLNGELTRSGIPVLALPGNHDIAPAAFHRLLGCEPGLHLFGGYGLVLFDDVYGEDRTCARTEDALAMLRQIAADHPDLPLIALQHPPIYPAIDSHYPYRPTNAAEILDTFEKSKVVLSLSGHYHKGQKARMHEGVLYHTVPSLSEAPFRFSLIRLTGHRVEIEEIQLAMGLPNLIDVHCHTEYAYCGTTVNTASCIALSQALGVTGLCITEHAFQLYFDKKEAMGFAWQRNPEMAEAVWATPERKRMAAYKRFAQTLRSPFVKVGLEVDLYDHGKLLLAPEDAESEWDLLVGAIHLIEDYVPGRTSQKEAERLFLRDVELLTGHPIQVLAHPFRFFSRNRLACPTHLYAAVADLLADTGVAAEVNFHTHQPHPDFLRICVEKGVRLALASDTHDLAEAGEFWPHVQVLKQAGVTPRSFPETLFRFT
jgi:histidinol phosphatase-like PHP family hydrolase